MMRVTLERANGVKYKGTIPERKRFPDVIRWDGRLYSFYAPEDNWQHAGYIESDVCEDFECEGSLPESDE